MHVLFLLNENQVLPSYLQNKVTCHDCFYPKGSECRLTDFPGFVIDIYDFNITRMEH